MEHTKTRNLSVAEYFLQLQKEYLTAEFRRKIYFNPKDKAYYQKVMGFKKEKIESIAKRNRLKSIFNDNVTLSEIQRELFTLDGKPKFEMTDIDRENYYATGNEFSYKGEIWMLDQANDDGSLTLYSLSREQYENATQDEVCRIL
nr:MAG TPA: hypothetical protein [Caudoviricetes sp.]